MIVYLCVYIGASSRTRSIELQRPAFACAAVTSHIPRWTFGEATDTSHRTPRPSLDPFRNNPSRGSSLHRVHAPFMGHTLCLTHIQHSVHRKRKASSTSIRWKPRRTIRMHS